MTRTASKLVPQALHVPAVLGSVEVEIPDSAAARLDPPVLAIAAVGPPPAASIFHRPITSATS